jgi:hypothetical protein
VDARHKAGHDELCGKALFYWLLFESDSEEPALAGVSKDEPNERKMFWRPELGDRRRVDRGRCDPALCLTGEQPPISQYRPVTGADPSSNPRIDVMGQ